MPNDNWWRNFDTETTKKLYWFDLSIEEVALISHTVYHKLDIGYYKTVTVLIENIKQDRYAMIVILSEAKLTRKEVLASVTEIPHGKKYDDDWMEGR